MNLPQLDVPRLLKQHGLRPDKSLAQNFLIDPVALQRVVEAAEIRSENVVLEIGPGQALTGMVKRIAKDVITLNVSNKTDIEKVVGTIREMGLVAEV